MSFARRGSHRKIYATRGYEAEIKETTPFGVEEKPPKDTAVPVPAVEVCQHGGEIVNGIPRCGNCFKQPNSDFTAEESFVVFLDSLMDVCKRVVCKENHRDYRFMSKEQKIAHCFGAITDAKHLLKIFKADKPNGMAYTIADRRLMDWYRSKAYKDEQRAGHLCVSQLTFPDGRWEWGGGLDTDSARLEYIDTKKQAAEAALDRALFERESYRYFPGVTLLWTEENIRRLMNLVSEAMSKLPHGDFSWSILIKLRSEAFGGSSRGFNGKPQTWPELAEWASDCQGKKVSEKAVRYAFEKGTALIRAHILKHLTPTLGTMTKKNRAA
jgi:hypothetical protein